MNSEPQPQAQPRQFLRVLLWLTTFFATVELAGGWLLDATGILLEGAVLGFFAVAALRAQALVRYGRIAGAVQLVSYGLLAVAVLSGALVPFGLPTLVLVPLMAAIVALPYLRRRALLSLFAASFLAEVCLGPLSLMVPLHPAPRLLSPLLQPGSIMAGSLLALLLLHQFGMRLRHALELALAANTRLRLSEERFRSLTVATSQVVWTAEPRGLMIEDSPSWRTFTGQSYEKWKGLGWLDVVHPEDRERAARAWRQAVETRGLCEVAS